MGGPTPEGESLSEQGEGCYNVFEPEGEPGERGREEGGRNPRTYPELTEDEINGTRNPGTDVDLSPFSDYEKMCRLCESYEKRIDATVANNDFETYEMLARELSRGEGLVASDIRPGEEDPTTTWSISTTRSQPTVQSVLVTFGSWSFTKW